MRERQARTPSRDERGRRARAELEAAASMLTTPTPGDRIELRPDPTLAALARSADADLWAMVDSGGLSHERPKS